MIYVELPLWVVIVLMVALFITLIYLMIGDFLATIIYKAYKDADNKTKENKDEIR